MKCYHCGNQTTAHRKGCPDAVVKKTPQKGDFEPIPISSDISDMPDDSIIERHPRMFGYPSSKLKTYTSFLPIENTPNSSVASMGTTTFWNQPQVVCRIQRFWIDEAISGYFMLTSIRVTNDETLVCGGNGRVFGNLFRSGRWPLTDKTDAIFGIDLSGWPTITPAMRVAVTVENISVGACPFRACFEVLCCS